MPVRDDARFSLLSNVARPHRGAVQLSGHTSGVRGVAFSPDGATVATASWDTTVRLWDAATGRLRRELIGHTDYIYGVTFSRDGSLVASASADRTIRLLDAATGQYVHQLTATLGTPMRCTPWRSTRPGQHLPAAARMHQCGCGRLPPASHLANR